MDRLSPLAWVAIAIIMVVIVIVNLWMVALLRSKDMRDQLTIYKRPPQGISMEKMQKFVRVLRNPYGEQQQDLQQLSKMVQDLKDKEEKNQ